LKRIHNGRLVQNDNENRVKIVKKKKNEIKGHGNVNSLDNIIQSNYIKELDENFSPTFDTSLIYKD